MNTISKTLIVAAVVGGAAFYGGMKYNQSAQAAGRAQLRGQFAGQFGGRGGTGTGANGNFTAGDVIAKDAQSITLKTRDGSTHIVFYNGSTEVMKFAAGTANDVQVGQTVSVQGTANSDGSVTAMSIQVRPPMPSASPSPSPKQ